MSSTYLGFFLNRRTSDEFVAPVQAADAAEARIQLGVAYPDSRYQLLTVYSRTELDHVLAGVDRWPGVASKVQEPLRADLSKVTAKTRGLPPLPGQVQAKVEEVDPATDSQPMPAWMKSFVQKQPIPDAAAPKATPPAKPQTSALEQAMSAPKTSIQQVSVLERLKAAKTGQTVSTKPKAEAVMAPPRSGSVIDILREMRK